MDQAKNYTHLLTQEGHYIVLSRDGLNDYPVTLWPILGYDEDEIVDCLVITNLISGSVSVNFREDDNSGEKWVLGTSNEDYQFDMYGIERWTDIVWIAQSNAWHKQKLWYSNNDILPGAPEPSESNSEWTEITADNLAELDGLSNSDLHNTYFYRPISIHSDGNIKVTKTGDHIFTVEWLGLGTVVSYTVKDHLMQEVYPSEDAENNFINLIFEKDGVYVVELKLDDNAIHYAQIYDMTDAEKCFLDMLKNVLCECVSCDDCPGPLYNRALNMVNMYITLRDIIYAELATQVGLISTEILNSEFVSVMGKMIVKLGMLVDDCTCEKE